jgi:hypothetical protein
LSEKEFRDNELHRGVNPRPGRNLLEKLETEFIFSNENFNLEMQKVCGDRWRILDYKFVMGIPQQLIPNWLNVQLKDTLVANLGAYVKPKYRDITYFQGIDFHQDIIDFPERESDFITAYIYLDKVGDNSAPLHLLSESYKLGPSIFPHNLKANKDNSFTFKNDYNDKQNCKLVKLTGNGGTLYYWHSSTLHGTQPQSDDTPRLSIRILVEKNRRSITECLIDEANKLIKRPLNLHKTRSNVNADGKQILFGNQINKKVQ